MNFFDHFADSPSTPIGDWITRRTNAWQSAMISRLLPDLQSRILEIGPGTGTLATMLFSAGYRRYSVAEPNNRFRQRLNDAGFSVKNYFIPTLVEHSDSYDAIILQDVFEHLNNNDEAISFVNESYRVLKPNGLLFIMSPDLLHWKEDFFNCDYSHNNPTTLCRVRQLFYDNSFETIYSCYYSGFFCGLPATPISRLFRIFLAFSGSAGIDKKFYKLKLNFLRRFIIVGRKQPLT